MNGQSLDEELLVAKSKKTKERERVLRRGEELRKIVSIIVWARESGDDITFICSRTLIMIAE